MLYLRNTSFSKLAAVRRQRLSVKTAPHTENTLSLDVLVAGTDSNCLAISAIWQLSFVFIPELQNIRRIVRGWQHRQ